MALYRLNYKHQIAKAMTCTIEAETEDEALEKLHSGDYDDSTEECISEDGEKIYDEEIEPEEETDD